MKSATATPAVMIAVVNVITTAAVPIRLNQFSIGQSIGVQVFPQSQARMAAERGAADNR
jgi:hypothetical protein